MIELEYFSTGTFSGPGVYQIIQFGRDEPWRITLDGELLGSLEKLDGKWRQLSGADLPYDLFAGISALIDRQHFNTLPTEILSRWPNLVSEVVARSDSEYLVICKEGISFRSFERIFCRFVPGLLRDEWEVNFKVFNHDFSDDFSVSAKPAASKKDAVGWQ